MLADDDVRKIELISSLAGEGDGVIQPLLNAWREDALYIYETSEGTRVPVQLVGEKDDEDTRAAVRVDTGAALVDAAGKPVRLVAADLTAVEHSSPLRRAMKGVLDIIEVGSPDPKKRIQAIQTIGFAQELDKIPAFQKRLAIEEDAKVRKALLEAIAVTRLKDPVDTVKLEALKELKVLHSLSSYDLIRTAMRDAETAGSTDPTAMRDA